MLILVKHLPAFLFLKPALKRICASLVSLKMSGVVFETRLGLNLVTVCPDQYMKHTSIKISFFTKNEKF